MKKKRSQTIFLEILTLLMIVCLVIVVITKVPNYGENILFLIVLINVFIILCYIFAIIVHELGHALFGAISGYRFISFRIFSYVWIKKNGFQHIKKYNIPGTAGQCIMGYLDFDENSPFILYHLGGALLNFIAAVLFFVIASFTLNEYLYIFVMFFAIFNLYFALVNIMPIGNLTTDGNNIKLMKKSKANRLAAFNIMDIVANVMIDKRFRDMEYYFKNLDFYLNKSGYLIDNFLCAYISVLEDQKFYQEAYDFSKKLLEHINKDVEIIYNELICEIILLEIILDISSVEKRCTDKVVKHLKASKYQMMKLVTLYAIEEFVFKDENASSKIDQNIKKIQKNYAIYGETLLALDILEVLKEKKNHLDSSSSLTGLEG